MLTSYKYELKHNESLHNKILNELNLSENEYFYNEKETTKGLLKTKITEIEIVKKDDIISYGKDYLKNLFDHMNIAAKFEISFEENILKISIISDDKNILIGKNGKTLESINYMLKNLLKTHYYKFYINLDVEDYKIKKQKRLEKEINKICQEVLKTKISANLDPMNSFERRIVHSIVSEFEELISVSHGENKERYTIIKHKD